MFGLKEKKGLFSNESVTESLLQFLQTHGVVQELSVVKTYKNEPYQYMLRPVSAMHIPAHGTDFFSEENAKMKCLGETYERFTWMHDTNYRKDLVRGTETQLRSLGTTLSLSNLRGFSREQRNKYVCLQYNDQTVFSWLRAKSLHDENSCYIPAQLISSHYWQSFVSRPTLDAVEPMLRWGISTGVSTGRSKSEAIQKSTLEVIERAVWMENFNPRLSPKKYSVTSVRKRTKRLAHIISLCDKHQLTPHVLKLKHPYAPLNVTAVLCIDTKVDTPVYFTMGMCAHFSLEKSIEKAFEEALALRHTCRYRLEVNFKGNGMGLLERALHYAKKENFDAIDFLIKGKESNIDTETQAVAQAPGHDIRSIISLAKENSFSVYQYTFSPQISHPDFFVACVVIPELLPMHSNESIPYYSDFSEKPLINPFS